MLIGLFALGWWFGMFFVVLAAAFWFCRDDAGGMVLEAGVCAESRKDWYEGCGELASLKQRSRRPVCSSNVRDCK